MIEIASIVESIEANRVLIKIMLMKKLIMTVSLSVIFYPAYRRAKSSSSILRTNRTPVV